MEDERSGIGPAPLNQASLDAPVKAALFSWQNKQPESSLLCRCLFIPLFHPFHSSEATSLNDSVEFFHPIPHVSWRVVSFTQSTSDVHLLSCSCRGAWPSQLAWCTDASPLPAFLLVCWDPEPLNLLFLLKWCVRGPRSAPAIAHCQAQMTEWPWTESGDGLSVT